MTVDTASFWQVIQRKYDRNGAPFNVRWVTLAQSEDECLGRVLDAGRFDEIVSIGRLDSFGAYEFAITEWSPEAEAAKAAEAAAEATEAGLRQMIAARAAAERVTSARAAGTAVPIIGSTGTEYIVSVRPDTRNGGTYLHCTCPGWAFARGRGKMCKHIATAVSMGKI